jgi:hypothetical protein
MKRGLIILVVILVYLALIIYGLTNVYSVQTPLPEKFVVEKPNDNIGIARTEVFGKLERPQVIFNHKKHIEAFKKEGKQDWETCDTCHPISDDKTHILFDFPKKVKGKGSEALMNGYHDECIGCHKDRAQENKKAGPINCGDCHKKDFESVELKYPVFEFDFKNHDDHVKKLKEKIGKDDCSLCHHTYDINEEDESLALVYEEGTEEACEYCHEFGKKRGPELTAITRICERKNLPIERASHITCLNCHLYYSKVEKPDAKGEKKVGPLECSKCHTGKYRTIEELAKVPRPDRDQPERPFLDIENAKMKGVSLDHKSHQTYTKNCRSCHHETLKACNECHTMIGKAEARGINISNAYHDMLSEHSCSGCHEVKKQDKKCAGCHHAIAPMDLETKDPKKETCALCHTGKKEGLPTPTPLSIAKLDTEKVKKEVTVKVLKNEFEAAKFPHLKIIEKLVKNSNDSKLASYFHPRLQILCEGCHHQSRDEAEAKKDTPPYCRNCHSKSFDTQHVNRPRLIAAYHRQCIQCHKEMDLEKPKECKECHKEIANRPKYIQTKYDEPPVKQKGE